MNTVITWVTVAILVTLVTVVPAAADPTPAPSPGYQIALGDTTAYDFKLHELRHTAASLAIQAGANIKALQNMLGHESAGLTLDRYGHLYGSDGEAVGVATNALLTRDCGQNVVSKSA
jgi:hypothetical protein